MFGLRIPVCLALIAAGCGSGDLFPVGVAEGALNSCNVDGDCPLPTPHGTCVKAVCNNHACQYAMDATACPTGCTAMNQATECNLGATNCFIVPCTAGACDFSDYAASSGCQCKVAGDCAAGNGCQNTPTCNSATCTYTAKQPLLGSSCCNITADCGDTASCAANTCDCGTGNKFCPGATVGNGRCVPSTGCCAPSDCPSGNACQTRTCSTAGACGLASNGNAGCCNVAGDCGGTATCTANTCSCGSGEKFCPGASAGAGACIPTSACCVDADCPARAHATATCDGAHACVYTCKSGFHDCAGTCKSSTSVDSCGTSCTACPSGNACQTPTCNAGACGFGSSGASPCCSSTADCVPANSCQQATACTANQCVFGSTGAAGCCNSAADCPPSPGSCLMPACVANQCATAPVPCDDLGPPPTLDLGGDVLMPPDMTAPLSASGGGGCALAGDAAADARALVVTLALALLALSLRRRA